MELDGIGNDIGCETSHTLRLIGPVLKALQSLVHSACLLRYIKWLVNTRIHITIELRDSLGMSMLLSVPSNILVVDAPSTELVAQHFQAYPETFRLHLSDE